MMKIIKPAIGMIVLAFTSLILITGSPFQISSNLGENNGHLDIKNIGQKVYAAEDEGGGGDDGGGDDGGGDDGGGDDGGGDDGGGDDGGGDDGGGDDGGGDDGGGDGNGDSGGDFASFGEDSDDGSDGNGSDEGTSTSDDSENNMVEENNDGPENDAHIENSDVANVIDAIEKDKDTGYQNADTITLSDEAEGSSEETGFMSSTPAKETIDKHKETCKESDGKWKDGECKFETKKGDDKWNTAEEDKVAFEHNLEDEGLYDSYEETQNEKEQARWAENNKDSDGDGIYDDEELSDEEEERLAEHQQEAYQERKEKTKEICLGNDGTYDGKCEFKDDDGTAEQDQVDFEHSLADRGLWEEYDRNYNGADWEYDGADA